MEISGSASATVHFWKVLTWFNLISKYLKSNCGKFSWNTPLANIHIFEQEIVVTLTTRFQNIWIETSVNILEDSQIYYILEKNLTTILFNFFNKKNVLHRIGICCFFTKHAALRKKIKDWLTQNQNNVSEWGDMFICGLLFQWASTIKIKLSVLV